MRCHTRLIGMATLLALAASGGVLAQDLPDPYFIDSNGDGIDGELADAIFVAPGGNDLNDGLTPSTAVASINTGITRAVSNARSQVLVQVGTYGGSIIVAPDILVSGGYDTNWARVATTASTGTIVTAEGTTVVVDDIDAPATLQFLVLRPTAPAAPGSSSYSVRVAASSGPIALRYNRFEPTNGRAGMSGTNGNPAATNNPNATAGQNAEITSVTTPKPGGTGGTSGCGRNGGSGGNGGVGFGPGQEGGSGQIGASGGLGGSGSNDSDPGGPGQNAPSGNPGASGTSGILSASRMGTVSGGNALYVAPVNTNGTNGSHGNGGGGGGGGGGQDPSFGTSSLGAGGGGGGAGGCGGGFGTSGNNGGGSFGVVIGSASNVLIEANYFKPGVGGDGGDGGDGAPGSSGRPGASGGIGSPTQSNGGRGGSGGDGGDGGPGGSGVGGHGGPSIGLLDPDNFASLTHARWTQPAASLPGSNGNNASGTPQTGLVALRHPTAAIPLASALPILVNTTLIEPIQGSSIAQIPVGLSAFSENVQSFGFSATAGSAQGGGIDYTLDNGGVTFNPWTDTATISVVVHADAVSDSGETWSLAVSGIAPATATITILEDALFANGFE